MQLEAWKLAGKGEVVQAEARQRLDTERQRRVVMLQVTVWKPQAMEQVVALLAAEL